MKLEFYNEGKHVKTLESDIIPRVGESVWFGNDYWRVKSVQYVFLVGKLDYIIIGIY